MFTLPPRSHTPAWSALRKHCPEPGLLLTAAKKQGFNPPLTSLDLLTTADARDLLTRPLGPARVAREPVAVDDIKPCTATGERRLVVVASPI